jgi:hypothetical protein
MKKIAMIGLLSLATAGAFAQGQLIFSIDIPGNIVAHIYSPDLVNSNVMTQGNSAIDTPVGSTVYTGTLIGGATGTDTGGTINYTYGNNFTAQIYAAVKLSGATPLPFSSLLPVSSYVTTMATSGNPGPGFIIANNLSPDLGIPNTGADPDQVTPGGVGGSGYDNRATISLACWYNAGNTINSLAAASAAHVPFGYSTPVNLGNLGEPSSVTAFVGGAGTPVINPANPKGLTSFDLMIAPVPEPSTIALGVLGACAFLARRRKS